MAPDGWSSKKAFVLASIGAAVGLGNIWRFPYIASQHGGVWFIVPYFICLILVGIPLFLLETGQGHRSKKNFPKTIEQTKNLSFVTRRIRQLLGAFPVLVSTVILGYYAALCSWTLWFAASFILGAMPNFQMMQQSFSPIIVFIVIFFGAYYAVAKGIGKGIEPVTNVLVPLSFVFLVALLAYSLTLPSAISNLQNAFASGAEKMIDPRVWYYALSQVLFSLSVGYGIMFTYGMHVRKGKEILSSAFQVAGADTAASLLAFFTIIAIGIAGSGGLALSFEILPTFFASQGFIGSIVGTIFFLLLFSVAFTSVISMLEHTKESTSFLPTIWKWGITASIFLIGLFSTLSYTPMNLQLLGKPVLDILDFVFGTFLAPFSALAVAIGCAYLMPHHKLANAIGLPKKYEKAFEVIVRKVVPTALLLLIIFSQMSGLY
jgi:NSS family neurotransmitter:Na+ symporter